MGTLDNMEETKNKIYALIILGNTNLDTFKKAIRNVDEIVRGMEGKVKQVFLLDTPESGEGFMEERKVMFDFNTFSADLIISETVLSDDISKAYAQIVEVLEQAVKIYNKSQIIIDLTNGKKIHSSALYAAASLIGIENLYQIDRSTKEYIHVPKFDKIETLPRVGNFDIIYYLLELDKIFRDVPDASLLEYAKMKIKEGILEYFSIKSDSENNKDFEKSVSQTTKWVERTIEETWKFLVDTTNSNFKDNNTTDRLKRIKELVKGNKIPEDQLKYLRGIPYLLDLLWNYRHIPAHQSKIGYLISEHEARILIETSLEVFRRIKEDRELWDRLREVTL